MVEMHTIKALKGFMLKLAHGTDINVGDIKTLELF